MLLQLVPCTLNISRQESRKAFKFQECAGFSITVVLLHRLWLSMCCGAVDRLFPSKLVHVSVYLHNIHLSLNNGKQKGWIIEDELQLFSPKNMPYICIVTLFFSFLHDFTSVFSGTFMGCLQSDLLLLPLWHSSMEACAAAADRGSHSKTSKATETMKFNC